MKAFRGFESLSTRHTLQIGMAMKLYKFVKSAGAVENMIGGSLKFTPIGELNDPAEVGAVFDKESVRQSLRDLRQAGLSDAQFHWLRHQEATLKLLAPEVMAISAPPTRAQANAMLRSTAYDNSDFMELQLTTTIRIIRSKVGVLSLSARYDSMPMWAHYADDARGFVVVLESLENAFPGDATGSLHAVKPVVYADPVLGMTFDPSTQDRLFFSKHSDWSYECEWRVVVPLDVCRVPVGSSTLRLLNIPSGNVAAVICGWNADPADVARLRAISQGAGSATTIIEARYQRNGIWLDRELDTNDGVANEPQGI